MCWLVPNEVFILKDGIHVWTHPQPIPRASDLTAKVVKTIGHTGCVSESKGELHRTKIHIEHACINSLCVCLSFS